MPLRTKLSDGGALSPSIERGASEISSLLYETANEALLHCLRNKKEEFMQNICNILTVAHGVPTGRSTRKDKKAQPWTRTPGEFYKKFSSDKLLHTLGVSLTNDPRNECTRSRSSETCGVGGTPRISMQRSGGRRRPWSSVPPVLAFASSGYLFEPTDPLVARRDFSNLAY